MGEAKSMEPEHRPLSAALGVEVLGVDLTETLDDETSAALVALFERHHLLLFRSQQIDGAHQVRLAECFGPVLDESTDDSRVTYVSNALPEGRIGEGRLLFHSDLAFTDEPILAISLYAIEVPSDGAPTLFANTARAAANLPDRLRRELGGAHAVHIFDLRRARGDRRFRVADLPPTAPRAVHPVLKQHPRLDVPLLFVSEMQTDSIIGRTPDDSEALLDAAKQVLYEPDNVYEHRWRVGDLAMWDNLALQHARGDLSAVGPRTLRRVPVGLRAVQLQR
jgi:taurine dioxygenase